MIVTSRRPLALLALALALASTLPVQAATWNKSTSGGTCNSIVNGTGYGSAPQACTVNASTDAAGAGSTMTMTGWTNAPSGTGLGTTGTWRAASITNQGDSGVGVFHGNTSFDPEEGSASAPGWEHAVDNNGATEGVRLDFASSQVALSSVTFGWRGTDADFTLLRWVGGAGATGGAGGMANWSVSTNNNVSTDADNNAGNNIWNGWQLVGNYAGPAPAGPTSTDWTVSVNSGGLTSSYWLVLSYNSAFGTGNGLGMGDDSFKLLSVAGRTQAQVSEPGALVLALSALGAGVWIRRRKA